MGVKFEDRGEYGEGRDTPACSFTPPHSYSLPRKNTLCVYLQIRSQIDFRRSKSKHRPPRAAVKVSSFLTNGVRRFIFLAPFLVSRLHLFTSRPASYPPQAKWQVEEFAPSDQVTAQMPQPNAAHSSSLPLTLCLLRFLFLHRGPGPKIVSQSSASSLVRTGHGASYG